MKTIIAISGRRELSKKFVSEAIGRGYEIQKINPARASKEVSQVIIPRGKQYSEEDEVFYSSVQEFLDENNGYYWYTVKKIRDFLEDSNRRIALLVNTSAKLLEELKDDVEAFCVHVGNGNHAPSGYDLIIPDDESFSYNVDRILSTLTKNIENVKYQEK